jgi:acetyl-CoA carboxylase biotin carboxyl carrier protein
MKFEEVKELIAIFDDSGLATMDIKNDDFELSLSKVSGVMAPAPMAAPAPAPVVAPQAAPTAVESCDNTPTIKGSTINAPMVGTFYKSPSPEASAFVKVGDVVKKGQTLCILEAMKIMNEIEAEYDCKILSILVDDSQPVEYNMPIFEVEKV